MAQSIKLATWNVRGLYENKRQGNEAQMRTLLNTLEREKISIVAVSETKIMGTGSEDIGEEYKMYYHGVKNGYARGGIAIVLNPIWKSVVITAEAHQNDRIMSIKLHSKSLGWKKNILVVAIYAPTTTEPSSETTKFYKDLDELIKNQYVTYKESYYLALMGDFNAWIGREIRFDVTGEYGNPKQINDHGKKLIKLATDLDLKITNTFFKNIINYTCVPRESLLDYIIVDKDFFEYVQDTQILLDTVSNISTDHYLVYTIIKQKESNALATIQKKESNTLAKIVGGVGLVAVGIAALSFFMDSGSRAPSPPRVRARSRSNSP